MRLVPRRSDVAKSTTGALVVRVWREDGDVDGVVRCRLLGRFDVGDHDQSPVYVTGVDGIVDAVRTWVEGFVCHADDVGRAPAPGDRK